jgi:hypothetical protein
MVLEAGVRERRQQGGKVDAYEGDGEVGDGEAVSR